MAEWLCFNKERVYEKKSSYNRIRGCNPIGNTIESFWNAAKEGKNGIDKISFFDTENFKVKVAAEVKTLFQRTLGKKKQKN